MHQYAKILVGPVVVLLLAGIGWQTRNVWQAWLIAAKPSDDKEKKDHHDSPERVKLSPQAQRNLRLDSKAIKLSTYERKIHLPGTVVDKPGHSDRGIPAPIAGVITQVFATPGKTVRVQDDLFRLKIASESFQTSQMELYKNVGELEIVKEKRKRLEAFGGGALPPNTLLELQYQEDRLKVLIKAYRQDLQTRQLDDKQITGIMEGKLVTDVVIKMPARHGKESVAEEFEVQELKVNLGDHVQAGQLLAYVADHHNLYIEGRALGQEIRLLTQATKERWPAEAEFAGSDDGAPERLSGLTIDFLGNVMDSTGWTLPVYVPFSNPSEEVVRGGKLLRVPRFRPGQKVLLKVTIAKVEGKFVLPIAAVVREGGETYVFRQNGDAFYRRPVRVLTEDSDVVVIENDGSIGAGNHVAHNGAAALNRALKASQAEGGGHGHSHD